jgi:hypothetical protein
MFDIKNIKAAYVILCPDGNFGLLQSTVKSLKIGQSNVPFITVVSNTVKPETLKQLKTVSKVHKAKDTITSLMNTGMRNSPGDWTIFIMAGTWLRRKLVYKYSRFIESDTDILYPIIPTQRDHRFKSCSLNGLCINKKVFKKVGPFAEKGDLSKCKEEWSLYAYGLCNSQFKAILGAQIC